MDLEKFINADTTDDNTPPVDPPTPLDDTTVDDDTIVDDITSSDIDDTSATDDSTETTPEDLAGGSIYDQLKSYGILDEEIDLPEDDSDESVQKAISLSNEKRTQKALNQLVESLPEDFKDMITYALNGGSSVEDFLATANSGVDSLDLEDENDQAKAVFQYYKETSSYSEDKISRLVARLKNSGDLADAAKESVEDLKEWRKNKRAELLEQQQNQQAAYQERLNEEVKKFEDSLKSYSTTTARKEKLTSLFRPDDKGTTPFNDKLQAVKSNYNHLLQLSELLLDYDPKTGFNFEKIKQAARSESIKSVKTLFASRADAASKRPNSSTPPSNQTLNLEDFLKLNN